MAWTTAEIGDQTGRVALVTGATSGLGQLIARVLAGRGAHVVLATRDEERTHDTQARIRLDHPDASLEHVPLDLADLASVEEAAGEVRARHDRLDLLIANAGLMGVPLRRTAEGAELHLAVNHLGHHALCARLLDLVVATPRSRVVVVSSIMHRMGRIDRDDPLWQHRRYRRWRAYSDSKLANLLYVRELDRRLRAAGHETPAVAAHPGYARTGLQHTGPRMQTGPWGKISAGVVAAATWLLAQPPQAGVLPLLYAATAPDVDGGSFWGPGGPGELRGDVRRARAAPQARDDETARWLWDLSEHLTGVRHPV